MPKQRRGSEATTSQRGGGSIGQSLKYVDPLAPEQSATAGGDLLKATPLIARPAIGGTRKGKRGGFYPSVMAGVVDNALLVGPLAAFAGRKLFSRKSRRGGSQVTTDQRGGGKKGNIWRAQQEEAKASLLAVEHAKPTAQNIAKYAAAKRKGSMEAENFLELFTKRVQEKHEAIQAAKQAKKQVRNSKKASKKAEKNAEKEAKALVKAAAKALKNAEKAAVKAAKAATKKVRVPKANKATKKNERAPSALQLKRLAEANAAAAKAAMNKTVKNGQTAWKNLIAEAKARLATSGKATSKNAKALASLMKEGKNTASFLNEFRTRSHATATTTSAAAAATGVTTTAKKTTAKKNKTVMATAAPRTLKNKTVASTTTVAKKPATEGQKAYFKALSNARTFLGTVGAPTGPNMSKYASMKIKGENTSKWLENFKTRRPLSMAKPPKTTKAKTPKKTKALTTVKENNTDTENNMQGYSEDFEPETNKNEN